MTMLEEQKNSVSDKTFGNARAVRTIVEKAESALALRLVESKSLPAKGDADAAQKLMITLADIQSVDITVPKKEQRSTIGFKRNLSA